VRHWQLQEAKARLSEVVKSAREGPQEISVRGEPAAVVLSIEAYERLKGKKKLSLYEFLRRSPLVGVDLDIERDKSPARDVDL
jgi:prevent-host-death family protein